MSLLLLMGDSTPSIGSLFASGEAGLALDVETAYLRGWIFQDSAGATTVSAAAGDPVGLILDTAKGGLDSLGSELVTNGTFTSNTTGWTATNSTLASVNGELEVTATSSSGMYAGQTVTTTSGKFYLLTASLRAPSANTGVNSARVYIYETDSLSSTILIGASQAVASEDSTLTITRIFRATASTAFIQLGVGSSLAWGSSGDKAYFDNISVREIPGNHAYQTTSGSRPALARTPDGGRRNLLTGTDAMATQSLTVLAVQHTLSFQGTGTVTLSGASTSGPLVGTGAANIVSLTFTPTAGSLTLTVTGTVQLAQLETGASRTAYQKVGLTSDVTESGKRDCWGLLFDGSDDSLQTASVDFSATDKMTVMAGVRKLSGSALAALVELSSSTGNNGSFGVYAPRFVLSRDSYGFISRGTTGVDIQIANNDYLSPNTSVLACQSDISGDSLSLRANGVSVATSTGDQGSGNYANEIVYIGSRSGSLRFNGLIYTLVIRGATTPTGTIADFERNLLARRCGVTF